MNIAWILLFSLTAEAARLKDLANIKGVRDNILIGYGLVVGLKGTGDTKAEVTSQTLGRLFSKMGLESAGGFKSKNAAAVIVTAKLPPFARSGNQLDVTVSSVGDASSLEGGVLLVTPLRAGDQNVYAVAQGALSLGGPAEGVAKGINTHARVVAGATVERDLELHFLDKKHFQLGLRQADFTTSSRIAELINGELSGMYATARDSGTIDVVVPAVFQGRAVELVALLENLPVVSEQKARVVLNERTGTVAMGADVRLLPVALSHGDLAIEIKQNGKVVQSERVVELVKTNEGASISDLVKALNVLGVAPKDLSAIFQALREVGALQAELELL
jgi:flagellar P-ring protein FlgI